MTARQEFIDDAIDEFYFRKTAGHFGVSITLSTVEEYATEIKNQWANSCTDKQFDRVVAEIKAGVAKKEAAKKDRWSHRNGNN